MLPYSHLRSLKPSFERFINNDLEHNRVITGTIKTNLLLNFNSFIRVFGRHLRIRQRKRRRKIY